MGICEVRISARPYTLFILMAAIMLVWSSPSHSQTYYPEAGQQPTAPPPAAPYYPAYPYAYPPAYGYGYPPPYFYPQQPQVVPVQPQVPVDPSTVAPYRRDNDETFYPLYYYDN